MYSPEVSTKAEALYDVLIRGKIQFKNHLLSSNRLKAPTFQEEKKKMDIESFNYDGVCRAAPGYTESANVQRSTCDG